MADLPFMCRFFGHTYVPMLTDGTGPNVLMHRCKRCGCAPSDPSGTDANPPEPSRPLGPKSDCHIGGPSDG